MSKEKFSKQMVKVMNIAWSLVKVYGYTMSEALKQSWKLYKLRIAMKSSNVSFRYKKADGSIREAIGTTNLFNGANSVKFMPKVNHTDLQFRYFDVEKNSWRSFSVVNLI